MKREHKTGDKYARWTILHEVPPKKKRVRRFLCRCDCGTEKELSIASVVHGGTHSCGCLFREIMTKVFQKHGHTLKHTKSPTYTAWAGMLQRHKGQADPHNYRDRGITVCEHWMEFTNFLNDMGEKPEGLSLDRIDNEKGYFPGNCRWADRTTQNRNRRNTVWVIFKGERRVRAEVFEEIGLSYSTYKGRIRKGWGTEKALTTPTRNQGRTA